MPKSPTAETWVLQDTRLLRSLKLTESQKFPLSLVAIERIACSVTCVRWADFKKRSGKRSNLGRNQICSTVRAVIPTCRPHHGNARPRSLCPERPGPFPLELAAHHELGPNNRRLIFTVPHTEFPQQHQVVARIIVPADYMVTLGCRVLGWSDEKPAEAYLAAFEPAGDPNQVAERAARQFTLAGFLNGAGKTRSANVA